MVFFMRTKHIHPQHKCFDKIDERERERERERDRERESLWP